MAATFHFPSDFFTSMSSRRLRLDGTLRSLVASPKAHGRRPLQGSAKAAAIFGVNYVLRGRGRFTEPSGQVHQLTPGVLFHRQPGLYGDTWFDPESDYAECYVVFDGVTGQQLKDLGLLASSLMVTVGVDQVIIEEFRHLMKRINLSESQLPSVRVLLEAITFVNDLYDRARRQRVLSFWEQIVEDASQLLEHTLDERIAISDIAKRLGVSYAAFRKHFKIVTGYAPADYRVRRRLESAQLALMTTSVSATALEFGYSDPYAFSAQFKSFLGMSPRAFKRRMHQKEGFIPLAGTIRS